MSEKTPWAFLDDFRGKLFEGTWPTLPEMFRITTLRFGERPCFTIYEPDRKSLSYRQALAIIEAVARYLYQAGIRKGDAIALTGKNSPEWTVAYLGIVFAGGTVVPIDHQLTHEELAGILQAANAKMLFVDEEKHDYYTANPGGLSKILSLKQGLGDYVYELDGPQAPIEAAGEFDTAAILFTSGTMGKFKGVMLTHQNLVSDCYLAQGAPMDVQYTDVFYALLPLHHAYTMLAVFIETISTGAEVVFGKRMITKAILKDLKEAKITYFLGVPMLFNKLLSGILKGIRQKGPVVYGLITMLLWVSGFIKKVFKLNPGKKMFKAILEQSSLMSVKVCICGGGPLAPSVFRKYNQLGIDFVQGYGLTETSPIINLNPVTHYKETSVGKIIPGVEEKVLNPDGRGIGEIVVKGPVVMKGYLGRPDDTAAAFTEDGFLRTGDLGFIDSENYLYLTGRAKNIIVTEGGKNVYPEEIENEFQLFDEVEQILIRGFLIDKKLKSEGIEALVYPNPEVFAGKAPGYIEENINKIVAEVNKRLRPWQKIERVHILETPLAMTTTKKIIRARV
ncbi:AMP-dependent synthetase/ligase [Breznakiellaceae bacterium SP9]